MDYPSGQNEMTLWLISIICGLAIFGAMNIFAELFIH